MHAGRWHGHGNQPAPAVVARAATQQPFTEACEVGSGLAGCSGSMQDARWMQDAKQQADADPAMGRYCTRRRWELEWEYWEGGARRSGSLWLWPWIISLSLSGSGTRRLRMGRHTSRQTDKQVWLASDDDPCLSLLRRTSTRTIIDAIISAIISLPAPDHFTTRLPTTSTNTRPTAACSTLGQALCTWVCWD